MPTRSSSQSDPLIGQVIGNRYRITGIIGEGGMGVVYVGEQQMGSTIRKVAVKTLHPHLSKDENVLKRFHRECGTVAQLEHPNTIKVYDFGSTPDGTLYIAMEFVAGRALSEVLQTEQTLSADRVIQILRQVCGALDEAHQLGIVHRDLKPDNIILTQRAGEQDFVKVLDFGIAARTESADAAREQKLTQQGTVLGTPPYMSPEQFTGKALDRRSDVYSLGVMAYEMLTGKLPFEAETPWQWATQHMTAQPAPFEISAPHIHLADPMRQAILRSLAKDREQRQAGAGQFINELSSGTRITPASATAANAMPYQATAAMPEMPNFSAAPAMSPAPRATVAQGAMGTAIGSAVANAGAMPGSPMIAAPRKATGGKSGLVLGLAGGGVAIAAIMVVFLVRSNKPADDPAVTNPTATASAMESAAPATLAPEVPTGGASPSPALTPPPEPGVPHEAAAHKAATKSTTAGATSVHTATSAASASAPPVNNPPAAQPPAQNNAACTSCISAISAEDFNSAARYLASCTDAAGKKQCQDAARNRAMAAAKTAAANHDCNKLRVLAAGVTAMGLSLRPVQNAADNCK